MTGLWTAVENRPLAIGQAELEGRFSHRRPQPLKNADAFHIPTARPRVRLFYPTRPDGRYPSASSLD